MLHLLAIAMTLTPMLSAQEVSRLLTLSLRHVRSKDKTVMSNCSSVRIAFLAPKSDIWRDDITVLALKPVKPAATWMSELSTVLLNSSSDFRSTLLESTDACKTLAILHPMHLACNLCASCKLEGCPDAQETQHVCFKQHNPAWHISIFFRLA